MGKPSALTKLLDAIDRKIAALRLAREVLIAELMPEDQRDERVPDGDAKPAGVVD